ncbi:MAG: tetratricopeptide repeat protein [Candidatus Hydrogenedentota bacterium]
MSPAAPEAPAYGGGGDTLGARRHRRAFIFCVLACLVVTGLLWFAERYLRYERAEQLYQQALTHVNDTSAQFFLSRAVELDKEQSPEAAPRYLWALAERETEEDALEAFAEACAQDPRNPRLAMRYGTVLYSYGQAGEAAELFARASAHAPDNALPLYLRAAALARTTDGEGGSNADRLAESLALTARANAGRQDVGYPPPVWSGALPRQGQWRAYQRRRIVEQTGKVLRDYADRVLAAARRGAEEGNAPNGEEWLSVLETMGERMAQASNAGTRALVNGLLIQRDSLRARREMGESHGEEGFIPNPEAASERLAEVEDALLVLAVFEDQWGARARQERQNRLFPLRLAGYTAAGLVLLILAAGIVSRWRGTTREHWTLRHGKRLPLVMLAAGLLFLLCLALGAGVSVWSAEPSGWFTGLSVGWLAIALGIGAYGVYYPQTVLTPPSKADDAAGGLEDEDSTPAALDAGYRRAKAALIRRYLGILFGVWVCAWCVWVLGYRFAVGVYPWEFRLMPSLLVRDEFALAAEILQRLG